MSVTKFDEPVYVTKPTLPDLNQYTELLEEIWSTQWLTNNGKHVRMLEARLSEYLNVPYVSAMANGTLALMIAMRALCSSSGNVVTTPFTFPATAHAIHWLGLTPVFADVDPQTGNIDPDKVEALVDKDTRAVLAVHVYGNPCDNTRLSEICHQSQVPLIYDAAHAFGVNVNGESILSWGDAAAISFHATKLFSTIEGGAVTTSHASVKDQSEKLRNFGIVNEDTVEFPGINAKMSEVHAAYGLLTLEHTVDEIAARSRIATVYDEVLADVPGIRQIAASFHGDRNFSYYPIRVSKAKYGRSRDQLHRDLTEFNVFARKYFYPLCTRTPPYSDLPSAAPECIPNAQILEAEALCLPIYGELGEERAHAIAENIVHLSG